MLFLSYVGAKGNDTMSATDETENTFDEEAGASPLTSSPSSSSSSIHKPLGTTKSDSLKRVRVNGAQQPAAKRATGARGGKGLVSLKEGGAKRHRKVFRDNIQSITKPAIRRLARRGGVKRMNGLVYEETRGVLRAFLEATIRDCISYTTHAHRNTVSPMDVVYALKLRGKTLYGY